jgi:putative sigma-54 modulation protein
MKITISFKHLKHSETTDERIHEKTMKLEKYLDGKTKVDWICSKLGDSHLAEIELHGPHFDFHASAKHPNLYKVMDMALDKIEKQLVKQKEKMTNRMHRKVEGPVILDPEQAWTDYDEDYYKDIG